MRKRAMSTLALVTVVTFALAACGSSSEESVSEAPQSSAVESSLHDALPDGIKESGVLRLGGQVGSPPYLFVGDSGKEEGFVVDALNAVAEKMGVKTEITNIPFASILTSIQADRIDLGVGAFIDTKSREEIVDFVDYIVTGTVTVVPEGNPKNITGPDALCGFAATVVQGTPYEAHLKRFSQECVDAGKPAIELATTATTPDSILMVKSGRADVWFNSVGGASWALETGGGNMEGFETVGESFGPDYQGVAALKGNDKLTNTVFQAFQEIVSDGTYDELLDKWKLSKVRLDQPIINGATADPLPGSIPQ